MKNTLSLVKKINIRNQNDHRGKLGFLECKEDIPFNIQRVFYILGAKKNEIRGKHAHKRCNQFLISLKGSIKITCDDGSNKKVYKLDHPYEGLLIPPLIWGEQHYLSKESILIVLSDYNYDEEEYIRDYDNFILIKKNTQL